MNPLLWTVATLLVLILLVDGIIRGHKKRKKEREKKSRAEGKREAYQQIRTIEAHASSRDASVRAVNYLAWLSTGHHLTKEVEDLLKEALRKHDMERVIRILKFIEREAKENTSPSSGLVVLGNEQGETHHRADIYWQHENGASMKLLFSKPEPKSNSDYTTIAVRLDITQPAGVNLGLWYINLADGWMQCILEPQIDFNQFKDPRY